MWQPARDVLRRGRPRALAAPAVAVLLLAVCERGAAQPPGAAETTAVRGSVQRMTTAPRGEVDGAVLDDDTWLHWPPHLQDRFTDVVRKGDRVRASGRTETGPAGDTHFEVERVTNLSSSATAENPDCANGPPPPCRPPAWAIGSSDCATWGTSSTSCAGRSSGCGVSGSADG